MPDVSRLAIAYETGQLTSDQFFEQLTEMAGIRISRQEFIDSYTAIFTRIDSTATLIRQLKPHYRLGLLSNTNEWHYEHNIKTVDVFPLFDAVSLSFEVCAMKPAPAIYEDMLRKIGSEANACLYIDDIPEYVEAAKQLGMHAIQHTGHDALIRIFVRILCVCSAIPLVRADAPLRLLCPELACVRCCAPKSSCRAPPTVPDGTSPQRPLFIGLHSNFKETFMAGLAMGTGVILMLLGIIGTVRVAAQVSPLLFLPDSG
jgi:putative hydrolase of the HAD superfamily